MSEKCHRLTILFVVISAPLQSIGRPILLATLLAVLIGAASACAIWPIPNPQITCDKSVTTEDCDRAVELARPLLSAYWGPATKWLVHAGICALSMSCPPPAARNPRYITVEPVAYPSGSDPAFVTIDRHQGEWTAQCLVWVMSLSEAHTEPCAQK